MDRYLENISESNEDISQEINLITDLVIDAIDGQQMMSQLYIHEKEIPDPKQVFSLSKQLHHILSKCSIDDKKKEKKENVKKLNKVFESQTLFRIKDDPIIQIGNVFYDFISKTIERVILVVPYEGDNVSSNEVGTKTCDDIEDYDVDIIRCHTEKDLLIAWKDLIKEKNPDLITGYNIFGFDFKYIIDRVEQLQLTKSEFYDFGRLSFKANQNPKNKQYSYYRNKECREKNNRLSVLGDKDEDDDFANNIIRYIQMDGRLIFDVQQFVQKNYSLGSYKLDNVAAHFMRGKSNPLSKRMVLNDSFKK